MHHCDLWCNVQETTELLLHKKWPVLAKFQSQVLIKSSVECAPIYKEAETTSKNRNHNLKRSSVPIFTDHVTLVCTSIPVRVVGRYLREQTANSRRAWSDHEERVTGFSDFENMHFPNAFCEIIYASLTLIIYYSYKLITENLISLCVTLLRHK
jgi:hypothetical protein